MTKANITYALLATLALLQSGPAFADTLQGNEKGFKSRPLTPSAGRPLLQSFSFRFSGTDHHFGGVEVAPENFQARNLNFGFSDTNGDDLYSYNLTVNRYFGQIRGYETEREFCHGKTCRFDIKKPTDIANPVFVIVGFYLQFRGGDHHIKRIGFTESNGFVTVTLNDKTYDNDDYSLDLKYAWIPRASTTAVSMATGTSAGSGHRLVPIGKVALRGFLFDLQISERNWIGQTVPSDRHIRDLAVAFNGNGGLDVRFGDKTPTERFTWRVDYAVLR